MLKTVDVAMTPECGVELFPLLISRDGDDYVVGRRGAGSYLAVSPDGMRVMAMLQEGLSPRQIKDRLASQSPDGEVGLRGFLESLLAAGFVRAVDGKPVENATKPRMPTLSRLRKQHIAWLFSRPLLAMYVMLIGLGAGLLMAHPHYFPSPSTIVIGHNYAWTAFLAMILVWANVAKHEAAHVVAGKYVGVDAYCSLSHRLFFPVIQTDLTDLWTVPRARRYIAYAAGIVSDLLVAAVVVIVLWLHELGQIAAGTGVVSALRLLLLVAVAGVLWQFNFFLRTDIYYIVTTALGYRNLAAEARAYAIAILKRRPTAAPHLLVRVYAFVSLLGTGLLSIVAALYVAGVLMFVLSGTPNRLVARASGLSVLVTAALLACSILIQRRRIQIRYRLIAPLGFAIAMFLIPPAGLVADVLIVETTRATIGGKTADGARSTSIKGVLMRIDQQIQGQEPTATLYDLPGGATIQLDAKRKRADSRDISARDAELEKEYPRRRATVSIAPAGAKRDLAGSPCDEFTFAIDVPMTKDGGMVLKATGSAWIATGAPGADDYERFARAAIERRVVLGYASSNKILLAVTRAQTELYRALADLHGIPYLVDMTMKVDGHGVLAGLVNKTIAGTRTSTVTKVTVGPLADATFAVPDGWKREKK